MTDSGDSRLAVLEIEGVISESKEAMQNLVKFKEDDSIKGVILRINFRAVPWDPPRRSIEKW